LFGTLKVQSFILTKVSDCGLLIVVVSFFFLYVKYIRFHIYEYAEWMFASNLSHRDGKPKYMSKFWTKHGGDGKRWPLTPFPFLAPWPSYPPAIEIPPRPVPAGPLISWPKNASCCRIPPRASRAFLPPRRWAMTRHRLSHYWDYWIHIWF